MAEAESESTRDKALLTGLLRANLRRQLSEIAFFFLALVVPMYLVEEELLIRPTAYFALASFVLLSFLFTACMVALYAHKQVLEELGKLLSREFVVENHRKLAESESEYKNVINEVNKQLIAVSDSVGGNRSSWIAENTIRLVVRDTIDRARRALELAANDPENAGSLIGGLRESVHPTEPMRPFLQLAVNALLLTGIVGTFYGLLTIFDFSSFSEVLKEMRQGLSAPQSLEKILRGLQIAFATSLTAYVGFLFGRTMRDRVDEDYDDVYTYLSDVMHVDLPNLFAPMTSRQQVDLPTSTKAMFSDHVEVMTELSREQQVSNERLKEVADSMASTAAQFAKSTAKLDRRVEAVAKSLRTGRVQWEAALKAWKDSLSVLSGEVGRMISSAKKAAETTEKAAEDSARRWEEHEVKLIMRVNATLAQIESIWRESLQKITLEFTEQIDQYKTTLQECNDTLQPTLKQFEDANKAVIRIGEHTASSRDMLTDTIGEVRRDSSKSRAYLAEEIRKLSNESDARSREISGLLTDISSRMERLSNSADSLTASVAGDGAPGDLRGVLAELSNVLSERAVDVETS